MNRNVQHPTSALRSIARMPHPSSRDCRTSAFLAACIAALAAAAPAQNVPPPNRAETDNGGPLPPASVTLWDQSAFDANIPGAIDQDFVDFPSFSSFMVDDFDTGGQTWNVKTVTTYFTKSFGSWDNTITSGKLQVYPKAGSLPSDANDIAPEHTVSITLTDGGGYWIATADTSAISELQGINGSYWIGLTPTADYGTYGQEFHEQLAVSYGGEAAWRNFGGGFGLGQGWTGVDSVGGSTVDMAFKLEGDSAGGGSTWYADADSDGYGDAAVSLQAPSQPPGYVAIAGDCDDANAAVNPGAPELCDGLDNDCNGIIDDGFQVQPWYADADGDGYGDPGNTLIACAQPPGYIPAAPNTDCDDTNPLVNPGMTEVCNNGLDDDCDGLVDVGGGSTWYADNDGDGWGDAANSIFDCSPPPGYIAQAGDCNDADPAVNPGATETCNGIDDNCNGQTDEGAGTTWYADADADGYGDAAGTIVACAQPGGYVAVAGDCDDTDPNVNPGAFEVCGNNIDDDCNGQVDDGCCPLSFQSTASNTTGTRPRSIAVGDFDDDGKPDLAVANLVSNTVSILRGNANGTFQPKTDYSVGNSPDSIATADFNGDARLDLAVANDQSKSVSILLADPAVNGSFRAAVSYTVGSNPRSVAAGDFDGNGRPDLAVANLASNTVSILISNPDGTFQAPTNFSAGGTPQAVAVGDFDGDGSLDLVVANVSFNSVSVLLADPLHGGEFLSPVSYGVGITPYSVTVGNFDGDAHPDLAVPNIGSNTVTILSGSANGTFPQQADYSAGMNPSAVAVADLNGDSYADLAVANNVGNSVSILQANANGTFRAPIGFAAGPNPQAIAADDFNRDGRPDLAVANYGGSYVSVLLNNGGGWLWYPDTDADAYGDSGGTPIHGCNQPNGYVANDGDCNDTDPSVHPGAREVCNGQDDDCDGIADDGLTTTTWYADSDGDTYGDPVLSILACSQPNGYVAIAGDCDDTNAAANPNAAELCDGLDNNCNGQIDEGFGSPWYADGDADGYGDAAHQVVACSQPNGYVAQAGDCDDADPAIHPGATELCDGLDNNCDGQTDEGLGTTWYADSDADGYGDAGATIVACAPPGGYVATAGDCDDSDAAVNPGATEVCGNGIDDNCDGQIDDGCCPLSFQARKLSATGSGPQGVAVADFNGDGRLDLVAANSNVSSVSVLLGQGDGTFTTANYVAGDGYFHTRPFAVAVGDFNGDGVSDVAAANMAFGAENVAILLGLGDGTFRPRSNYGVGTTPKSLAVGDFNADGYSDVVVANSGATTVTILLGRPDGTLLVKTSYFVPQNPESVVIGEFNGDGLLDMAVASRTYNQVSLLQGNGDGTFQAKPSCPVGAGPRSIALGDFNADGHTDLAVANAGDSTVSVLLGNGNGTFQAAANYAGDHVSAVAVGEFDGDGHPDLAVSSTGGGVVSVLLGKPDGTFKPRTDFSEVFAPSVVVGDFDRDGRPDLALSDFNSNKVSVRLNNGGTWLWYADADADGYGDAGGLPIRSCNQPQGRVATGTDCDDGNPAVHPWARETCDGLDNDCNGVIDDSTGVTIVKDPTPQSANLGATVQFSATDIGGTAWQWLRNGNPILGATGKIYSIIGVQESDGGLYSVIVSNACGQAVSAGAELLVQPSAPTNLAGFESPKGVISLTWTDTSTLETGFEVWYSVTGSYYGNTWSSPFKAANLPPNTTSYSDPGFNPIYSFRFRIRTVVTKGNTKLYSDWTPWVPIKPAQPSGLTLQKLQAGKAKLTWTDNSNFESTFTLERQKQSGNGKTWDPTVTLPTQGANTITFTDSPGTGTFRYRIRADNVNGSSAWTAWVKIKL